MTKLFEDFFKTLSVRFRSENDLSDIIWILCEINIEFKEYFLTLFFSDIDFSKPIDLRREVSSENSRPDFLFNHNDTQYLIEIKINDKNHHFDQYIKQFPEAKRGYIANYTLTNEFLLKYSKEYSIRTWSEVIRNSEESVNNNRRCQEIRKSFMNYLKCVCEHKEINQMKLSNLNSLIFFNNFVEQIVNTCFDKFELKQFKNAKCFSESWSGSYFSLKVNSKYTIYPWFGIHYDEDDVYISFDFEYKDTYCDILKNVSFNNTKGKYYEKMEIAYDLVRVKLIPQLFQSFDSMDVDKQKEILTGFFQEVIREVCEYIPY